MVCQKRNPKRLLWASMKGGVELLFFLNHRRVLQVWISNNGRSWEIHFFICKALSWCWGTWHIRSGKLAVWKALSAGVHVLDTCTHKYWNAIYFLRDFSRWTYVLHIICSRLVCLHDVLMSYSILVWLSSCTWQSSNNPRSHPLELSVLCGYLKTWSGSRISPCMWGM